MHKPANKQEPIADFRHEIDMVQMQGLAKFILKPSLPDLPVSYPLFERERKFRVAVSADGSLGDFMPVLPFLEKFYLTYAPLEIDIFVPEYKLDDRSSVAFGALSFIHRITAVDELKDLRLRGYYDLVIAIKQILKYWIQPCSYSRLVDEKPELLKAIAVAEQRVAPYRYMYDKSPYLDGLFGRSMADKGMSTVDAHGYFGNLDVDHKTFPTFCPDIKTLPVMKRLGLAGKSYITIHDGFDADVLKFYSMSKDQRPTRGWPLKHWGEFVRLFKAKYPDILVVQLGLSKVGGQITGVDVNLLDRTTLPEACWIIKHAMLHVDGETGFVRVGWATHAPTLSLQGPSGSVYFSFNGVQSIVSTFCNGCWWAKPEWFTECALGFEEAKCMHAITPQMVLKATTGIIEGKSPSRYELIDASLYDDRNILKTHADKLRDIFELTGLKAVPITQHAHDEETGLYMHASKQWEYLYTLLLIEKAAPKGRPLKIVDVGGGRGALAVYLALLGHDVTVVDMNYQWDSHNRPGVEPRFMAWAAKNKLKLRFGSLFNLPIESDSVDIALSMSVMEHVPYKEYALKEVFRILKPNGTFIMSFDFSCEIESMEGGRIEIFTPERLDAALREFDMPGNVFPVQDVKKSLWAAHHDGICGLEDLTVGAVAIRKLPASKSGKTRKRRE